MRSRLLLALGVSTLTVATAAVSVPVFARSDDGAARANEYVAKAERELARDKTERAVRYAEHAVEAAPLSPAARAMLARAYLADGRLNSAESATRDLLSLTPGDATATLNLTLIRASLGQEADARALLASADGLSPADKGLGLVLAGDVAGGGAILEAAARSSDADGRVRQNLAFAYAMAGDWRQARVVASQDLPPAAVHERIGEWAKVARPRNSWDRVAYLLNIQPVEDEGMPARLALQVPPAAPVLAAAVEPSPFAQELASYDDSDQQEVVGEAVDEPATLRRRVAAGTRRLLAAGRPGLPPGQPGDDAVACADHPRRGGDADRASVAPATRGHGSVRGSAGRLCDARRGRTGLGQGRGAQRPAVRGRLVEQDHGERARVHPPVGGALRQSTRGHRPLPLRPGARRRVLRARDQGGRRPTLGFQGQGRAGPQVAGTISVPPFTTATTRP